MKLKQAFESYFKKVGLQYTKLRQHCEIAAAGERWATEEMYDLCPLSPQMGFKTGKWLKAAPRSAFYKLRFQFDEKGRPVIATQELKDPYARRLRETFYVYERDTTTQACFDVRQGRNGKSTGEVRLVVLERLAKQGESSMRYEHLSELGGGNYLRLEYEPKDGRVVAVKTADDSDGELALAQWRVSYDRDGEVSRIEHATGGECPSIRWPYKRRSKSLTLPQLSKSIETRLATLLGDTVPRAGIREPVYCLALGYSSESELALPPFIGLGTEAERTAWVDRLSEKDLKQVLWNPEEFKHQANTMQALRIDSRELMDQCRYFQELHGVKDPFAPSVRLLRSVAKQLARRKWKDSFRVTDDFVVVAYDIDDAGSTLENLKASAPAVLVKRFVKCGWA